MIRRPPISTQSRSSAASDVYKRQEQAQFKDICSVVSIADLLAKAREISSDADTLPFVLKDQQGWHILRKMGHRMDLVDIERLTFEIEDIGREVKEYLSAVMDQGGGESTNG